MDYLPTVSKLCDIGITPDSEIAPWEGRKPKIPQYDAGTLTLPPVSVPKIEKTVQIINKVMPKLNSLEWENSSILRKNITWLEIINKVVPKITNGMEQ